MPLVVWLAYGGREVGAPFVLPTRWRGRWGAACAGRHAEAEGAETGRGRLAAKEGSAWRARSPSSGGDVRVGEPEEEIREREEEEGSEGEGGGGEQEREGGGREEQGRRGEAAARSR